jgi:EAL domain-containing protein (putative c-di-GMP-specific phosphodiesterase class I)
LRLDACEVALAFEVSSVPFVSGDTVMTDPTFHSSPRGTGQQASQASSDGFLVHVLVVVAIATVATTVGIVLVREAGLDPAAAISLACAVFLAGASGHMAMSHQRRGVGVPRPVSIKRPSSPRGVGPSAVQPTAAATGLTAVDPLVRDPTPVFANADAGLGEAGPSWAQELASGLQSNPLPAEPTTPRQQSDETEFERVERLVKRLADNVNEHSRRMAEPPMVESVSTPLGRANVTMVAPSWGAPPVLDPVRDPHVAVPSQAHDESHLAASIHALRSLSGIGPSASVGELGSGLPVVAAGSLPVVNSHAINQAAARASDPSPIGATEVLAALDAHRLHVALEPIVDLAGQRPQHYEVSIGLFGLLGESIDLAGVATDFSGTGLLPLIDAARVTQAAHMARRLAERGRQGSVLTALSGEGLTDAGFEATARGEAFGFEGQIVLTLPQGHVRGFANADTVTLSRLRAGGFAFGLCEITSLDMDFAALADVGFVFAKLDADTFLNGLPIAGVVVSPTDICRHLDNCGLTVIVEGIIADDQLARIHACGVLLGQGQLFGGPRAVKVMGPAPAQVAAE